MNTYLTVCACFLVSLTGCSHDHPVADHQHDPHTHNDLYTLGLLTPYVISVDPPLTDFIVVDSTYDPPLMRPFGYLTKKAEDGREIVIIRISADASYIGGENIKYPDLDTTPVSWTGYLGRNDDHYMYIYTDCSDPDHTGIIAYQWIWGRGEREAQADFIFKCPDSSDQHPSNVR